MLKYLQMEILDLCAGEAVISVFVRHELTNLHQIIHGGAVGSLLEMAMNLACYSLGRQATDPRFQHQFPERRQGRRYGSSGRQGAP